MPVRDHPRLRAALRTLLIGGGLGGLILGAGGRIAMRLIAERTTGVTGFSVGGTLTVVFLGAVSGAIAALILLGARALFRRWPPTTTVCFWLLVIALTLRGLQPLDQLRLVLFLPLVVLFGVLLQWSTWRYRQVSAP